jgi:hypothetical protein
VMGEARAIAASWGGSRLRFGMQVKGLKGRGDRFDPSRTGAPGLACIVAPARDDPDGFAKGSHVMKGIVFTEFFEMIEQQNGLDEVDALVDGCELSTDGAYTSVGTYDFRELVVLVQKLGERSGIPVPILIKAFGEHLFGRFHQKFPEFFDGVEDAPTFLAGIEDTIHTAVRKLYPDAELPSFDVKVMECGGVDLNYSSPRPFADFAEGLIEGCLKHFGESRTVRRDEADGADGTSCRFVIS